MAQPCYVYLKLKMPNPKGVITISGDVKRADYFLQRGLDIVDTQMEATELEEYKKTADPDELLSTNKPTLESFFQLAREIKEVSVHLIDASKTTQVATRTGKKQESELIHFLHEN